MRYNAPMCGRYELDPEEKEWKRLHEIKQLTGYDFKPNYNTAPTQVMPVITKDADGLQLKPMKWGIHRHIGPTIEKDIINTRADKAMSPFWAKTVRSNRCLIPATGFYEWKITDGSKQPHFIHPADRHLFMFAGIYSEDSEGQPTYSIMTTNPNKEMSEIHNRMPVILQPDLEEEWLGADDDDEVLELLMPARDGSLEMYPVSPKVNSPRNNEPGLSQPLA
jgi:putative SOS response-associated peptidase YedK